MRNRKDKCKPGEVTKIRILNTYMFISGDFSEGA